MSEPEDFLSRWSRRKREVAEEAAEQNKSQEDATTGEISEVGDRSEPAPANGEAAETGEPVFDISKLPSIDEITADTDIRPFLSAGVPAHLTQAALRKLWVADPKIRDFIEIAENQWDFNTGNIPGFDYSLPENAKELVAQIFSKVEEVAEKVGAPEAARIEQSETPEPQAAPAEAMRKGPAPQPESAGTLPGHERDELAQISGAEQQPEEGPDEMSALPPRKHGSALPT